MEILVRNNAGIPSKYIRLLKWRIRKTQEKFGSIIYTEVYISKEGNSKPLYSATIKIGVPGNDIILRHRSTDLKKLWRDSFKDVNRYLNKNKVSYASSL